MGGIRTALDLAEAQKNVVLIDKANAIGGLMTLLDRTFPTNNCDLCTISSTLSETNRNQYIQLMPLTQITQLNGEAGDFTAVLSTAAPVYRSGSMHGLRGMPPAVSGVCGFQSGPGSPGTDLHALSPGHPPGLFHRPEPMSGSPGPGGLLPGRRHRLR